MKRIYCIYVSTLLINIYYCKFIDDIFQEAIASRNSYCASLVSAVLTLQSVAESKTKISYTNPGLGSNFSSPKHYSEPSLVDKSGVRDEMHQWNNETEPSGSTARNCEISPTINVDKEKASESMQPMAEKSTTNPGIKQSEQTMPDTTSHTEFESKSQENAQSSDVFSLLLSSMFTIIFDTLFFVFIKLPIKITTWSICMFFLTGMMLSVWLYFADDNGCYEMGAMMNDYIRPEF